MACNDKDHHTWSSIPKGSRYELSVVGPAVAYAKYDDASTVTIDTWTDIAPGPHTEVLSPEGTHSVFIFVQVVSSADPVFVKARVRKSDGQLHGKDFCHTLPAGEPLADVITHDLEMV
jgi:hypothetical protein